MIHSKTQRFATSFLHFFLIYCLGLILFLVFRIYFTLEYGSAADLQNRTFDIASAFFVGYRTDTMSIAYGLLPVFLLMLGTFVVPSGKQERYDRFLKKSLLIHSTIVFGIFFLILVADFFFYRFFNDHLNVLVFALFEDDTQAVLTSVWTDYPIIRITALLIAYLLLFVFFIRKILTLQIKQVQWTVVRSIILVLTSMFLVFTALRNSFGMFPFRMQNTIVSDNVFINKIGIGGVYSLQNAFKEKSESTINTDINATLKKYKFRSVEEAMEIHLDQQNQSGKNVFDNILTTTAANEFLETNKPHVVVIQMESMSNYLLDFHSKDFNLLGDLEGVLDSAYVFRNFVSATGSTINSLEALLIASPETPISQSIYQDRKLSTSAALLYSNAGYNTCFITGAELAWRNLDGYLSNLAFKDIEGNATLKKNDPRAQDGEWGTYDEFMFDEVFKKLKDADAPQFIYGFTTTNHTPFDLPDEYKPYALNLPQNVESLLKSDKDVAMKNFLTYQYANDCLGKFIKRINESDLKRNTIIVAVGDHSISQLFNLPESKLLNRISIPCIIIVPSAYRPNYTVDQSRFGSHKDVFPTLYNLSLSNTSYVRSGNNLLAPPNDSTYFFGVYKYNIGFSKDGSISLSDNLSFSWADASFTSLQPTTKSPQTEYLRNKTRAYSAVMSSYIKNELAKGK